MAMTDNAVLPLRLREPVRSLWTLWPRSKARFRKQKATNAKPLEASKRKVLYRCRKEFYTPIIICILYYIDPADICGRSCRGVNPIIIIYIHTFDICVWSG